MSSSYLLDYIFILKILKPVLEVWEVVLLVRYLSYKYKELSSIPRTIRTKKSVVVYPCNPALGKRRMCAMNRIYWSITLAELVSFTFSEHPCLKI